VYIIVGTSDYRTIGGTPLTFNVLQNRVCAEIFLVNDPILENDESFTVLLMPLSESVSILTTSVNIAIVDDDGGC
jgi:hypothetical protein